MLVVEDDRQVRDLAVRALTRAGYTVLSAEDGERALALLGEAKGGLHLLLTDMILPRLSGPDLAERLADRYPGLRTLYVSGYTENAMAHRGGMPPGARLLAKPFAPVDLVERVREVLDAPD